MKREGMPDKRDDQEEDLTFAFFRYLIMGFDFLSLSANLFKGHVKWDMCCHALRFTTTFVTIVPSLSRVNVIIF